MKLRYSLPVRGKLRIRDQSTIEFEGWRFQFFTNEKSGYVNQMVIEILNVPKKHWPTIREISPIKRCVHVGNPPFPFEENENAFRFSKIQSQIINLESYLSVFGLEEIEFGKIEEKWLPESDHEIVSMRSGWSSIQREAEALTDPLAYDEIARCIVASNRAVTETAALASFRVGQSHMWNRRYIEAIRNLYLCIEYLFANGKTRKKATMQEFQKSHRLKEVVNELFFLNHHESFKRIRNKHRELNSSSEPVDFFNFLYRLRGELQHGKRQNKWHPSRQNEFEHEAVCIMNVAEAICFDLVTEDIQSVPQNI